MRARKTKKERRYDDRKHWLLKSGEGLVILFIVILVVFRFVIGISYVKGNSMEPTLHDGQMVAYLRVFQKYEQGDIVSVRMPSGEYYVKRVIAVGGDTVNFVDGVLYVNDMLVSEPYTEGATYVPEDGIEYPYAIDEGKVFVLGDNREGSMDSRTFGGVLLKEVQGKLFWQSK